MNTYSVENQQPMAFEHFQALFKNESINWKLIIESQLNVSVKNNTRIRIANLQKLLYSIRWLNAFDDETFLNWFYAKMFFPYRFLFQFYSEVDSWKAYKKSRTRNYQRREQCIDLLEEYLPYTMPVIVNELINKNKRKLVNDTLFRVASHLMNLIGRLELPKMEKSKKMKDIEDLLKSNYFSGLLPQLEPGDILQSFLKRFSESDSIIKFALEGEKLKDNKLKLNKYDGYIGEFPSILLTLK